MFFCKKFFFPTMRRTLLQPHLIFSAWPGSCISQFKSEIENEITNYSKQVHLCLSKPTIPHVSLKEFKTQYWTPVSNKCDHNDLINGLTMWYLNTLIACALITYLNETLKLLLIPVLIYETLFFQIENIVLRKNYRKKITFKHWLFLRFISSPRIFG